MEGRDKLTVPPVGQSKKSCLRPSITYLTPFLHPAGSPMTVPWPRDRYFLHFAMAARAGGRWAPDGKYIKLDLPRTMPARLGIAQYFQDAFCKMFINLSVAGNRLGNLRDGIMIPVVLSAVAYKHTTIGLQLSDEVFAFHRRVSSASFRTPGISPLVRSRYSSRRWACRSSNDSPCVQ